MKRQSNCALFGQLGRFKAVFVSCLVAFGCLHDLCAGDRSPTPAAPNEGTLRREEAIAEFTRKMQEANYPSLFEKAAQEFGVPAEILKGVAFAETRWEHLVWPPGETTSPETGKPRPFGIMSLWDNDYFGHSLVDAAKLIGKDPEQLKADPYQNIRGAAALLKQIYGEISRPDGTTEQDIESWRYAIAKYSGIPQPDLNQRHALDVYEFMSKGYHQYGIEWNARPVNLGLMREDVKRIVAEEDRKRNAQSKNDPSFEAANAPPPDSTPEANISKPPVPPPVAAVVTPGAELVTPITTWSGWLIFLALVLLCVIGYAMYPRRRGHMVKKGK